jgi:hypothetical protein
MPAICGRRMVQHEMLGGFAAADWVMDTTKSPAATPVKAMKLNVRAVLL